MYVVDSRKFGVLVLPVTHTLTYLFTITSFLELYPYAWSACGLIKGAFLFFFWWVHYITCLIYDRSFIFDVVKKVLYRTHCWKHWPRRSAELSKIHTYISRTNKAMNYRLTMSFWRSNFNKFVTLNQFANFKSVRTQTHNK